MREPLKRLKTNLEANKVVCGVVVSLADPAVSELVGLAGYDFVWIEGEHGALDRREIQMHMIGAHAGGAAAFVRSTGRDPELVRPILDMGPDVMVFPLINTAQDAREAVAACQYPPKGLRGFNPQRAGHYGQMGQSNYVRQAEELTMKTMIIEQLEGFRNIAEIIAVDGVDLICLGPGDLSVDMGFYGDADEQVLKVVFEAAEVCRQAGMPFMVWPSIDGQNISMWEKTGASIFGFSQDTAFISQAILSMWKHYNKAVPENRRTDSSPEMEE